MPDDSQIRHALTVLARLAQREPGTVNLIRQLIARDPDLSLPLAVEVAVETGGPITEVLSEFLADGPVDCARERSMLKLFPPSSTLAPIALILSSRLASCVPTEGATQDHIVDLVCYSEWLLVSGQADQAYSMAIRAKKMAISQQRESGQRSSVVKPPPLALHATILAAEARSALELWHVEDANDSLLDGIGWIERRLGIGLDEPFTPYGYDVDVSDPRLASLLGLRAAALVRMGSLSEAETVAQRSETMWKEILHRPDPNIEFRKSAFGDRSGETHIALPQTMAAVNHLFGLYGGGPSGLDTPMQALMSGEVEIAPRFISPMRARLELASAQLTLSQVYVMQGEFSRCANKIEEVTSTSQGSAIATALPEAWLLRGLAASLVGNDVVGLDAAKYSLNLERDEFRLLNRALPLPREAFGISVDVRASIVVGLVRMCLKLSDEDDFRELVAAVVNFQARAIPGALPKVRSGLAALRASSIDHGSTTWLEAVWAQLIDRDPP